jgi:hypothetical protein
LKGPEWQTLIDPANAPTLTDFQISEVAPPAGYDHILERVVLAHRLREVPAGRCSSSALPPLVGLNDYNQYRAATAGSEFLNAPAMVAARNVLPPLCSAPTPDLWFISPEFFLAIQIIQKYGILTFKLAEQN